MKMQCNNDDGINGHHASSQHQLHLIFPTSHFEGESKYAPT
jgi:hypothetical protein